MRSTLFIASMLLGGAIAVSCSTAQAAPWNADCVTFWGGKIPVEERTPENCPTGHSHWDAAIPGSGTASNYVQANTGTQPNYNSSAMITTNNGNYIVVPNQLGGSYPRAVIQVSRGK
jgi:hypothetical protein